MASDKTLSRKRAKSAAFKFWQNQEDLGRSTLPSASPSDTQINIEIARASLQATVEERQTPRSNESQATEIALLQARIDTLQHSIEESRATRQAWHDEFQQIYEQERDLIRDIKKDIVQALSSLDRAVLARPKPVESSATSSSLSDLLSDLDPSCLDIRQT